MTKVIDGIIGQDRNGEWISRETNPWVQLAWLNSQRVGLIRLYDRPTLQNGANSGTLTFSDGSTIQVTGIPNDGTVKEISFAPKTITWVTFQVIGGSGANVGLSEFQVFSAP